MMDRRAILAGSLHLLATPRAVGAQQSVTKKTYRIGILSELAPNATVASGPRVVLAEDAWRMPFRHRGYVEGQNAVFEFRHAGEKFERLPELVAELVRLKVDIIMTASTPPAVAAKRATTTIPIITISADPIGAGLVTSLARPGSNVTGLFVPSSVLGAKGLQLLREALPELNNVALLWNPLNQTAHVQLSYIEDAAKLLKVSTHRIEMRGQNDLDHVSFAKTPSRGPQVDLSALIRRHCPT